MNQITLESIKWAEFAATSLVEDNQNQRRVNTFPENLFHFSTLVPTTINGADTELVESLKY